MKNIFNLVILCSSFVIGLSSCEGAKPPIQLPPLPPPPPIGSSIVSLNLSDTSGVARDNVPVTFAQVFKVGDVPAGATLVGRIGTQGVNLQVDTKATNGDGSLRHAVITALLPKLEANANLKLELVSSASTASPTPVALSDLLARGFDTSLSINLEGKTYSVSAANLLKTGTPKTWLSGGLVTEWMVWAPLENAGQKHPHLTAYFDVRAYQSLDLARIDVTLENDWAFEPGLQGYTYDAQIKVGNVIAYSKTALKHYPRARWHKTVWWGLEPKVFVKHDSKYLITTGAVPNYDSSITVSETALEGWNTAFPSDDVMTTGLIETYFPATGGRIDIGLLPGWTAGYVISMDARAKRVALGHGNVAGSFDVHFRDKTTNLPLSLDDFNDVTILGNPGDTTHPFPACTLQCDTPYSVDTSHQPNLAYIPYLVTGDHFYLEELQFWANFNMMIANPAYRDYAKGLLKWDQIRGQGWSLRTLGEAAFITPDGDPMKTYFRQKLENNISDYTNEFITKNANALGINSTGYAFAYENGRGVAPWQDDFFTSAVGHLVEMGFSSAKPLLEWKAKFSIGRMTTPGYCWLEAATYSLLVRDAVDQPVYSSFKQAADATFGANKPCPDTGVMEGYPDSATGYPSNMQPALAMATDSGLSNGAAAWTKFATRAVKPNYDQEPQFAIVPRSLK